MNFMLKAIANTAEDVISRDVQAAGHAHSLVSRPRLKAQAYAADASAPWSGKEIMRQAVLSHGYKFAWAARQGVKPLTQSLDLLLGTGRSSRSFVGPASGVVGAAFDIAAVGCALAGGAVGGTVGIFAFPVTACFADSPVEGAAKLGAVALGFPVASVCIVVREGAAVASAVPKFLVTGGGFAVGSFVGASIGLVRLIKRPRNQRTLLDLTSVDEVPPVNRFTTHDGYMFDIEELVGWVQAQQLWQHPVTQRLLPPGDIDLIIAHPSGHGRALVALMKDETTAARGISARTLLQMQVLGTVLKNDMAANTGNPNSLRALAAFGEYFHALSRAEKQAIEASPSLREMRFSTALQEVEHGHLCIHQFGGRLLRAVASISSRHSTQSRRRPSRIQRYFTT